MIEDELEGLMSDVEDESFAKVSERRLAMSEISLEQAQAELPELIEQLKPGEEVEITQNDQTVAKLIGQKRQRTFGLGKGKLTIVQEDDEHLDDFTEYLP